jgi:DNA-binding NtrC family response regulator
LVRSIISAEGGVLFLDDVNELSAFAQALLVQVIETGRIRPVNATRDIPVDVRIIASTSQNLLDLVLAGSFREDLYYRLNVLNVDMPPLRQRPSDILDLATMFIENIAADLHIPPPEISASARRKLLRNAWPGNCERIYCYHCPVGAVFLVDCQRHI